MSHRESSPSDHRKGLIQIHLAAVLAGFTGLFGKFLDAGPGTLTAGRSLVACLALAALAKFTGVGLGLRSRRDLGIIALSGLLLAGHWLTFFQAIRVSSVAVGLLAFASYPLFVTFLEPLVFREKIRWYDVVAAFVVLAGLALVAPSIDPGNASTRGLLWGVLSGALCALVTMLSRFVVKDYPTVTVAFWQQGFVALGALPFALAQLPEPTFKNFAGVAALGIVFTAGLQMLLVASLRHIRAQTVSIVIMLEPVYGILAAMLFLGEIPGWRTFAGGVLVCGAALASTWKHASMKAAGPGPDVAG